MNRRNVVSDPKDNEVDFTITVTDAHVLAYATELLKFFQKNQKPKKEKCTTTQWIL